jgi:hypothetical protein
MKKILIAIAVFFMTVSMAFGGSVTLGWDALSCTDCGVKIYVGTAPGNYQWEHDAGVVSQTIVNNLNAGTNYYFAAKAYDTNGNYSGYSNEVSYTVPGEPTLPTLPPIEVNGVTISISIQAQ